MAKFFGHLIMAGLISLFTLGACTKADFVIGEDGWPLVSEHISGSVFRSMVNDNGWGFYSAYLIDSEGKLSRDPYYDGKDDKPADYLFSGSNLTEYFDLDAYPEGIYRVWEYGYDESENGLVVDGKLKMKVYSLKENFMTAIILAGVDSDGRRIFVRSSWYRMDEEELDAVKKSHPINYSRLLNNGRK